MKSGNYINVLQKIYYISFGNLLRVVARAAGVESHTATTLKNENICVYACVCTHILVLKDFCRSWRKVVSFANCRFIFADLL